MMLPQIAGLGPTELLIILAVIILLFGASKLPELARGSGRALRIFKAETKGLMDDDDDENAKYKTDEQRQIDAQRSHEAAHPVETHPVESQRIDPQTGQPRPDAER